MRIGINASFARKELTGIGQVTVNFLKKLSQQKTDLEFVLYLEEDLSPHQYEEIFNIKKESKKNKHKAKTRGEKNWCGDEPKDIKLPKNFTKRIFLPLWKRDDLVRKIWWEKYLLPRMVKKDGCVVLLSLYQCPTITTIDVAHIMVVHDIVPKLFPEYLNNSRKKKYWNLTEKAIKKVDKILAVSSRTEKDLIQQLGIEAEKISVNYIDCDEIYKKTVDTRHASSLLRKYKLKPGYILAGGGMEVRKNVEGVIRAYKYLLESNKTLHFIKELPELVIYGKLLPQLAPLAVDAEKLLKELNLTAHVKLLDRTPQADMPALFDHALFFVYPSHYEGFGIPVLEAMSVGTAVIASKKSSLPEVGLDSVLYCNPDDPKDIAMVMKNVLLNPELRATLMQRGTERAQHFSWEKFVVKALNVIKSLQ